MSKIENVKAQIAALEAIRNDENSSVRLTERLIEKAHAKLAALEAEAAEPQQWNMLLLGNGELFQAGRIYWGNEPTRRITVIEKKPVRVTREMAEKIYESLVIARNSWGPMTRALAALKAAGIDAIAAD